jgi:threonine aldolase
MLGGGMRQSGILAAAALWALDHNVERLADDHLHARELAAWLAEVKGLSINLERVQTNIVLVDLSTRLPPAERFVAALAARGVLCLALGPRRLRLVTHLDVDRAACLRAAKTFGEVARAG